MNLNLCYLNCFIGTVMQIEKALIAYFLMVSIVFFVYKQNFTVQ